jgi:hypothetical protein
VWRIRRRRAALYSLRCVGPDVCAGDAGSERVCDLSKNDCPTGKKCTAVVGLIYATCK